MMRCLRLLLGFCLCLDVISGAQNAYRRVAIPDEAYFAEAFDGALDRSDEPFTMSPVSAVGFELLSLTGDVMFDNILVSDSLEAAKRWTEDTWGQRKTPGVIEKLLIATVKRPWLWGVYVVTVGLPIILFISLMWPNKRFGPPDQDYYYKKTDEPQEDQRQKREEHISPAEGVNPAALETESRATRRLIRNTEVTS
ncbi:calnexin [Garra rufa]|uniref:calnexin n=1 Tax=Garra rufa TaxID=137080 RepID=UPI003CCEA74C